MSTLRFFTSHKNRNITQLYFALLCIACMFVGMLGARALVSIACICFCVNGILYTTSIRQLKALFKNNFYWGGLALLLITLVSGFWGSFNSHWQYASFVKLPMLVLPIGFFALEAITKKQFQIFVILISLLLFCGTCYSYYQYFVNAESITNNYIFAKVMPTPFDGNHIYFSFTLVCNIILLVYVFNHCALKTVKYLALFFIIWLVIYLHVLAAKTGILLLYASIFLHAAYFLFTSTFKKISLALFLLLLSLPILFYFISPTLKNRLAYIQYDYNTTITNINTPGLSDGSRWRSILAGVFIFKNNSLYGVGAGQIMSETNTWYTNNAPNILPYERMLPSSQILWYASAAGLIGLAGFCFYLFSFFYKQSFSVTLLSLFAIILIFLSYEIGHHGQYGVLVIMLVPWLWKVAEKNIH